jgi:hypothetical protein
MTGSKRRALLKQALVHFGAALLLLCMFAASDSWSVLTGWNLALLLSVLTGFAAGFAATTVLHEWFHLLGAWLSGGRYDIPENVSFFVYDWNFEHNTVRQFYTMSIAGSIGGLLSVLLLAVSVAPDSPGRVAVVAGAMASFALGSIIEWPVLRRTASSGQPLDELSKIDQSVLVRALLGSGLVAALAFWWLG